MDGTSPPVSGKKIKEKKQKKDKKEAKATLKEDIEEEPQEDTAVPPDQPDEDLDKSGADEKDDDLAGEWQTAYARGSSKPKEGPL